MKIGDVIFGFDNWIKQGTLYYIVDQNYGEEEIEVKPFITEKRRDRNKLRCYISKEEIEYIQI